ncbi:hypothetical protein, partial [Aeromonas caviae]|uniref:hypothetical protein n=1 Tax=Aeromonas caviae TaxID=648 RepID=UPI001CC5C64A
SRVGLDGKVWLGQWEARRAIEATQELEHTHGLTLTPALGPCIAQPRRQGQSVGMLKLLGRLDGAAGFPLAQP